MEPAFDYAWKSNCNVRSTKIWPSDFSRKMLKATHGREFMIKFRLLVFLPLVLAFAAATAFADSYQLTIDHCTGGCGPAPYGTITTSNIIGGVHVVVSLNNGNLFVLTGANGSGSTLG